jgi:alpha 1,3-glucosidase
MFWLAAAAFSTVDSSKFKQCDDMRFCRDNLKSKSHWTVENLREESGILGDLFLTGNPTGLRLEVSPLSSGAFRIRVTHSQPRLRRFDVSNESHVIDSKSLEGRAQFTSTDVSGGRLYLFPNGVALRVSQSPLFLYWEINGMATFSMNADQMLLFEDEPGEFKESFGGFTDVIGGLTAVGADFRFLGSDIGLTGLSERASPVNLADTDDGPLRLFNSDAFEYEADQPIHLYGSIPFIVAHSPTHSSSLFWMNPSDTFVDIHTVEGGRQVRFVSESGFVDLIVDFGNVRKLLRDYAEVTGFPAMPPLFALGYHQSRWGYESQHEVGVVMRGLDDAGIPFDALWLDVDHLSGKVPFTVNRGAFPQIDGLITELDNNDRFLVKLCDPHFPHQSDSKHSKDIRQKKFAVAHPKGTQFIGSSWPGDCVFPDFVNPAVVEWWAQQVRDDCGHLNVFYWNDMNEPSIFKSDESTFPKSLVHFGGVENREIHNLYGLLNTVGTHLGLKKRQADRRPFVLTRSFFAGSQKYAFTWTGDNTASWEHLRVSVSMVLTLGVVGMPFAGADIGGFLKSPDGPLLVRWFQAAAWTYPFFRQHCHHRTTRREPFMFEGEELDAMRRAIVDRYTFLPLWYRAARRAATSGFPVVAPVWAIFPDDDRDDQVIVDEAVWVVPILEDDLEDIKLKKLPGRWFRYPQLDEFPSGKTKVDIALSDVLVFFRGGSIVPAFAEIGKSALATLEKPIVLYIAPDDADQASGELYLDDGISFAYQEPKNEFVLLKLSYSDGRLSSRRTGTVPKLLEKSEIVSVVLMGKNKKTVEVHQNIAHYFDITL